MRARSLSILTLAAALVAAGCIGAGSDSDPASTTPAVASDWWLHAVPSSITDPDHDHSNSEHHKGLTTPNFEVLGYDPLVTDHYGTTLTGMGCGGVGTTSDERRIAVVHSISTDVAFVVADVTDPTNPVKLGEYIIPNVVVWDATVTPDGRHVLVGAYPPIFGDPTPSLPPVELVEAAKTLVSVQPLWRDACTGETRNAGPEQYLPFGPGLVMVGLQDPTDPQLEDWVSQPVIGPHSVSTAEVDGKIYATSSVTNLVHESSYYSFFEVIEVEGRGKLVPLSVIQAPGVSTPALNGHVDVEIQKHPITGQVLAYLANWNGGMSIYDFSIPQAPVLVSTWKDPTGLGSMHSTKPLGQLWDERHITLAGQEVGEPVDLPTGWIYILDTTDPTNPIELSRWTMPVKPKWDNGGLMFSTHYMDVVERTMFVSMYHAGLWAVDLSDVENPKSVGIFVPDSPSPTPFGGNSYGPTIGDVIAGPDGVLTVWDNAGGIYLLRFDASLAMPVVTEWAGVGKA